MQFKQRMIPEKPWYKFRKRELAWSAKRKQYSLEGKKEIANRTQLPIGLSCKSKHSVWTYFHCRIWKDQKHAAFLACRDTTTHRIRLSTSVSESAVTYGLLQLQSSSSKNLSKLQPRPFYSSGSQAIVSPW